MADVTFDLIPLSGSPADFRGIKITTTATAGTLIHTAKANATLPDLITVDLVNTDTVARPYVVEFGGATSPDDHLIGVLLAGQTIRIMENKPLRNALVMRIYSGTLTWIDGNQYTGAANVLVAHGHVQSQLS